jgi:hypothetical protein
VRGPAFNDSSNERLEQLQDAGLLDLISTPSEDPNSPAPRCFYRPTKTGRAMCRELTDKDAKEEQSRAAYALT